MAFGPVSDVPAHREVCGIFSSPKGIRTYLGRSTPETSLREYSSRVTFE